MLAIAVFGVTVIAIVISISAFKPANALGAYPPVCGTGHSMILSAQAGPSSAKLPCIAGLPSGWMVGSTDITKGQTRFWLNSDRAGDRAVTVTLTSRCDTSGTMRIRRAG